MSGFLDALSVTGPFEAGRGRGRAFIALPIAHAPSCFIPFDGTAPDLSAYAPYRLRAKFIKGAVALGLRMGWNGWPTNRVFLPHDLYDSLHDLVADVAGRPVRCLSAMLGSSPRFRRLTIRVSDDKGTLGYLKIPLTEAAARRSQSEQDILRELEQVPALRGSIPVVLRAFDWHGVPGIFISAGDGQQGPVSYSNEHRVFLAKLALTGESRLPGERLLKEIREQMANPELTVSDDWRRVADEALNRLDSELSGVTVVAGLCHGDFAPWNTALVRGRLFVFDWERAEREAPEDWDRMHFEVQTASLLGRGAYQTSGRVNRALYMTYLLRSAFTLFEEGVSCRARSLKYRLRELQGNLRSGR